MLVTHLESCNFIYAILRFPGYSDYSTAFYMYDALHLISVVTLLLMPVVTTSPSDHIITDLTKLFKLPNVLAFIFFLFALGNFWGFIESYLFLVLKELGARNTLLGRRMCFVALIVSSSQIFSAITFQTFLPRYNSDCWYCEQFPVLMAVSYTHLTLPTKRIV